jgi:hypothetical protein
LLVNLYGPFLLSGIRLTRVEEDFGTIEVEMALDRTALCFFPRSVLERGTEIDAAYPAACLPR